MIVLDASAWVRALMDSGPRGEAARRILSDDPDWLVPAHAPLEVLRTIRRYEAAQLVSAADATEFANSVVGAELRYSMLPDEWLLAQVWSYRHNLSVYDAPYVALSVQYAVALVTFDVRLAKTAGALGTSVVIPSRG